MAAAAPYLSHRSENDAEMASEVAQWPSVAPDEFFVPPPTPHAVLKPEAAWVADEVLVRLARCGSLARAVLGEIADELIRRGAHKHLAFIRIGDYSRERLGLSASQMYELARVARGLRGLPRVRAAFETGELGWTKVREIVGIATAATESEWLALAREYTADGLKIAVTRVSEQQADVQSSATTRLMAAPTRADEQMSPSSADRAPAHIDVLRRAAALAVEEAVASASASG